MEVAAVAALPATAAAVGRCIAGSPSGASGGSSEEVGELGGAELQELNAVAGLNDGAPGSGVASTEGAGGSSCPLKTVSRVEPERERSKVGLVRGCGKLMRVRRVGRTRVEMEDGGFMADVCVCDSDTEGSESALGHHVELCEFRREKKEETHE